MAPQHVLITGASSGIGAALSRCYARPGVRLSLTARDPARLRQVSNLCRSAGAETEWETVDIADAETAGQWITDCDSQQPIDIVIANAGIGGSAVIAPDTGETLATAREIVATNILGVVHSVIPLLPRFAARGNGHVVIMSSLAAYVGLPHSPLYSASKAAVRVYGQALRRLLAPSGVRVTVVCPGFVETPMSVSVQGPRPLLWSAERAAERIVRGIERGEREITFPWPLVMLARLADVLPPGFVDSFLIRTRRSRA
jgi:short-subunit dehydrogenase